MIRIVVNWYTFLSFFPLELNIFIVYPCSTNGLDDSYYNIINPLDWRQGNGCRWGVKSCVPTCFGFGSAPCVSYSYASTAASGPSYT